MLYDSLSTPALRQIARMSRMCGAQGRAQAALQMAEAQRAGQDAETRRLIDEALLAEWPGLARLRERVERDGAFGRACDGAASGREVARLRFLRWLHVQGRIGETADDGESAPHGDTTQATR